MGVASCFVSFLVLPTPENRCNADQIKGRTARNVKYWACATRMASQRGQYYETQYFHGQNLIIAWVKSFVHGQNHFSMGKFFLSMGESICAWAKAF